MLLAEGCTFEISRHTIHQIREMRADDKYSVRRNAKDRSEREKEEGLGSQKQHNHKKVTRRVEKEMKKKKKKKKREKRKQERKRKKTKGLVPRSPRRPMGI